MNIRTKAILFVQLIIIILVASYLTMAIDHQRQDLQNQIQTKKSNSLFFAKHLQQQAFSHYQTRIVSLATSRKTVIESFAKRDRDALHKSMTPVYEILKKENPYFQNIQFNLPDGTAFLRMHLPDFHGDNLSTIRPILSHVHRTKKQASGYEVGRSGLFYRVVQPMFYKGEYIGNIDFGIKYGQLMELLNQQISPHIGLVIAENQWQKATLSKRYTIRQGTNVILPFDSPLLSTLPKNYMELMGTDIRSEEHDFSLYSNIALNDFQNQPIAKVLIALDITENVRHLHLFIIKIIILTMVLLVLTGLVLHFSFGQLLTTIMQLNDSLSSSNEDLEHRVEERTTALAKSNKALQEEIIERKRLETDLRQAEKMRAMGTLASGIAHDFNNILTAILGYTQLAIIKTQAVTNDITSHLEKVEEAGLRAKDLVEQILTFSRQSDQKNQPLKLDTIITETLKLLRASIPANIKFITHIDVDCCSIFVNSTQIHQVIMNLCTNAHHAMLDQDGTLTITLEQVKIAASDRHWEPIPGNYIILKIDDTGCGMTQDVLERIFEPYFTTKEEGKGTGLGMAVVHGIIKSYNGHITAQSSLGEGSSFTVYLPCYTGPESHDDRAKDRTLAMGHNEHILVVDDEKALLVFWEVLLKQMGYNVTAMDDSLEAYHWFSAHQTEIDCIITDMAMPQLTGLELSKKILALAPDIPIALCTGYRNAELQARIQQSGIKAFVKKPVDEIILSQTLHSLLSRNENLL